MLRGYATTIRRPTGSVAGAATVEVLDQVTGSQVPLVDPDDRTTAISNPVTADAYGRVAFVARTRGAFKLVVTETDGTETTIEQLFGVEVPVTQIDLASVTKVALAHGIDYRLELHGIAISTTDSIELKFSVDGTTPVVTGYESRAAYVGGDAARAEETLTDACHLLGSETANKGPLAATRAQAQALIRGCVSGNWAPQVDAWASYMDEDGSATRMDTVATLTAADYTHAHIVPNAGTLTGLAELYEV